MCGTVTLMRLMCWYWVDHVMFLRGSSPLPYSAVIQRLCQFNEKHEIPLKPNTGDGDVCTVLNKDTWSLNYSSPVNICKVRLLSSFPWRHVVSYFFPVTYLQSWSVSTLSRNIVISLHSPLASVVSLELHLLLSPRGTQKWHVGTGCICEHVTLSPLTLIVWGSLSGPGSFGNV